MPFDAFGLLIGALLVLALVITLIVLPIVAISRTGRIRELDNRLWRLERQLHRLTRSLPDNGAEPQTEPRREAPVDELEPADEEQEQLPVAAALPTPRQPQQRHARPPSMPQPSLADFESWIGGHALGWIAVVLLLFAVAFFLKIVIERNLIGELGRILIGLAVGATGVLLGARFHRLGRTIFAQMLTAAGVVILYLTTYASFGYYHLLPQNHAAIFLVALVVEVAALAILYEAPAIALMAVIGGLLTPILLHTDRDQYVSLFTYLGVFNAGVVGLALLRPWPAIATLALAGTQFIFWGWYAENYHPLKLTAALLFQSALFALYIAHAVVLHLVRGRRSQPEDLARFLLNAFFFALAGYILLEPDYHNWLSTAAIGMATIYAALAWLFITRRPEDELLLLLSAATSLAFVAIAIPLEAEAGWIALGWSVEALALWWFGLRIRSVPLFAFAAFFFLLAIGRFLYDTANAHSVPFIPVVNRYALPALITAACFLAAAAIAHRFRGALKDLDRIAMRIIGLAGITLLWIIVSVETYQYFHVQIGTSATVPEWEIDRHDAASQQAMDREERLRQTAQTALSVAWAVFAAILLTVGFRLPSRALRWAALALFALTLGKVVLIDMGRLPGFYRVAAFLVLSLVLLAAAWGYQKLKHVLVAEEEAPDEN